jgi:elongation factor G
MPINELVAGDIGATLKLKKTHTNNTLHARGKNYELPPIEFPSPNMTVASRTLKKGEEEKLSQALHQLREEDPDIDR